MQFTKHEIQLLGEYLSFYEGLHAGTVPANTPERVRFLQVIKGDIDAEGPHEVAYLKYIKSNKQKVDYMVYLNKMGKDNILNPKFDDEIF